MRTDELLRDIKMHPGRIIAHILRVRRMNVREFAHATGLSENVVRNLIEGRLSITENISEKLSKFLDSPPSIWIDLQKEYEQCYDNQY